MTEVSLRKDSAIAERLRKVLIEHGMDCRVTIHPPQYECPNQKRERLLDDLLRAIERER